jgi:hypothetical protein
MSQRVDKVGSIQDLTEQVVSRTMEALRKKLAPDEIAALDLLVKTGRFFEAKAVLLAIARAQETETK